MKFYYKLKSAIETLNIEKLRKHQIKPINRIIDNKDTMVIAPTSAGKSAIFQVPALLFEGLTLVIEPTLSLMYDQVAKLKSLGIAAEYLDSKLSKKERHHILQELRNGKLKLLYVTPERLLSDAFQDAISCTKVSMLVVDECHCVTAWGNTFRDAYLEIGRFINSLPSRPIIVALTATANEAEREEIAEQLTMNDHEVFVSSLNRKSLTFLNRCFTSDQQKLKELKRLLKKRDYRSCIIYCNKRSMTDAVYDEVKQWYPGQVAKCHSNLSGQDRKSNETAFLNGERNIMVATSAFGMGVDKDDVDLVIHFNLPLSLADYYQQAGRAGRSGQAAHCILFYCEDDYFVDKYLLSGIEDTKAKKAAMKALDKMKEYANSQDCLYEQLLAALGEIKEKTCRKCSNCQRKKVSK